jgi:hypothetical protein
MRKLRARVVHVIPNPSWLADVERDTGQTIEITDVAEAPEANVLST